MIQSNIFSCPKCQIPVEEPGDCFTCEMIAAYEHGMQTATANWELWAHELGFIREDNSPLLQVPDHCPHDDTARMMAFHAGAAEIMMRIMAAPTTPMEIKTTGGTLPAEEAPTFREMRAAMFCQSFGLDFSDTRFTPETDDDSNGGQTAPSQSDAEGSDQQTECGNSAAGE